MAGIGPSPGKEFTFSKDGKFLDNQISADITVTANPAVAPILDANTPFPAGTTKIGSLSARVSGSMGDLKFASGRGSVSSSASASASSALAVYDNTADLLRGLYPDPQKPILEGLTIDAPGAAQIRAARHLGQRPRIGRVACRRLRHLRFRRSARPDRGLYRTAGNRSALALIGMKHGVGCRIFIV
jgi:hypothetical protein